MDSILSVVLYQDKYYLGWEGYPAEQGGLIVTSKEDFTHFKQKTWEKLVFMGRRTADSLPMKLPGRFSVCISESLFRDNKGENTPTNHPNTDLVLRSVSEVAIFGDAICIGGKQLYDDCLRISNRVYLTVFSLPDGYVSEEDLENFMEIDLSPLDPFTVKEVEDIPTTYRLYDGRRLDADMRIITFESTIG